MKTFFNILQTLSGITHKKYPDDPFTIHDNINYFCDNIHIIFLINNIFFNQKECANQREYNKNVISKNAFVKFTCLNNILQNIFYTFELKETIFNIFSRAQKYYHALSRFIHIYKIKKHPYVVTNDLTMNILDPNNKLTFILVEDKTNFLFNINEIINIIDTAIGNSPNFFCEPLNPLNPYNNQELTIATLYNIYFQMKKNNRVISLLFHFYFLEHFNKNNFVKQYEPNIRENAIKKYVFNSPHTVLYTSVISMLRNNIYTNNLCIHEHFPKDILVDIFRPFLYYDYIASYYIKGTTQIYYSKNLLYIKLKKFYEFNPAFGRENIKIIKKERIIGQEYIFNTRHISFYDINIDTPTQTNNIFNPINILINMPIIDNSIINIIGDDDGDEDGDDDGDEDGDDDGDDDEIEETNDTDSVS